ncbi:hypothetical protein BURPS305_4850 [Burkholderia pseudomallei 305]|nr:hypothetical protein BURPS305_4850 [Burkholderia pseudomallei 305]KGD57593.1 hypothetical protein DP49_4789 [Burkholderia pseudomallei]KGS77182.1 hypothetical protein X942_4691 [Burkholderia pseudomallei MSHR5596]
MLAVGSEEAVSTDADPAPGRHRVRRLFYNGGIALSDFSFPADFP